MDADEEVSKGESRFFCQTKHPNPLIFSCHLCKSASICGFISLLCFLILKNFAPLRLCARSVLIGLGAGSSVVKGAGGHLLRLQLGEDPRVNVREFTNGCLLLELFDGDV